MKIQPIVEGYSEVEAVPILLRRLRDAAMAFGVEVNRPIRRTRTDLADESRFRLGIRIALGLPGCDAILVLLDADDDCPSELGPKLQGWARSESGDLPCEVVVANREFEAWFLASIESLRGCRGIRSDATSHPNPEGPRDAKGQLGDRMAVRRGYSETADQPALVAQFDLSVAHSRSRSFRRMVRAFGLLLAGAGVPLEEWPPDAWANS